ncbi:MAG TPA: sugar ABC transporter ATP-binding protein [Candidatus Humimicrobiaceae bacterium]
MSKLVEMKGISKSFYGVEVLHDIDFNIDRGEIYALCGENGAGKSTLMKILAAIYKQDQGEVLIDGKPLSKNATSLDVQKLGIAMIHQELNLIGNMTVAQNIFLSREPINKLGLIDYKKMNQEAKIIISRLDESLEPTMKIGELKIAQKQLAEIAKAVSFELRVLIMDEPTAVLTNKETEILFDLTRKLSKEGVAIIYVSHRLKEIKQICQKITILRDGKLVATKNVDEVSESDIANLMVGRKVNRSIASDFKGDENDLALEVKNITDDFLHNVSFKVRKGEILGLSGLVGAGRTEVMEFIFGLRKCKKGEIIINGKVKNIHNPSEAIHANIGFATEDKKETGLVLGRSIKENVNYVYQVKNRGFVNIGAKLRKNTDSMIERLNIRCAGQLQNVSNLSGGNQQKVVLAKWLLVNSEILILDEPTRGIDVGAREEVYQIIYELAREGKTIIIVSSDLTEILNVCQRIIVMHDGEIKRELLSSEGTEENIMKYATNVNR